MENKIIPEKQTPEWTANMMHRRLEVHYNASASSALSWGFSNVFIFTLTYYKETGASLHLPFDPFLLLIIPAILQVYFYISERKERKSRSFKDEMHDYVWIAFGISILILILAATLAGISSVLLPLLLLLFAIPTFLTGCINKFIPLIMGGIICWVCSAICFFYKAPEVYLITAFGAFCAWVLPGLILKKRIANNINGSNGI